MPTSDLQKPYAYRLRLSVSGWAWEFLRRNPAYRHDWVLQSRALLRASRRQGNSHPRRLKDCAARWGLLLLEPPELNGLQAVPFWKAGTVSEPIRVRAGTTPRQGGKVFDLWAEPGNKVVALTPEGSYLAIEVGTQTYRLLFAEPEHLRDLMPLEILMSEPPESGLEHAAIKRFLNRRLVIPAAVRFIPGNAEGLMRQLQVLDCHIAGAGIRETAQTVFGSEAVSENWLRLKSRTRYLIRRGVHLMEGGYRDLLLPLRTRA